MTRDVRIKSITIPMGSLIADSAGNLGPSYTDDPITGTLQKVYYEAGDIANNGSVIVEVSGTGENIWTYLDADTTVTEYLFTYPVDNTRVTGSPQAFVRPVVGHFAPILKVWGSGCGSVIGGTRASGLTVYYI